MEQPQRPKNVPSSAVWTMAAHTAGPQVVAGEMYWIDRTTPTGVHVWTTVGVELGHYYIGLFWR